MKKNAVKKLKLSRETLRALGISDSQKVVGGEELIFSTMSGGEPCCGGYTPRCPQDTA